MATRCRPKHWNGDASTSSNSSGTPSPRSDLLCQDAGMTILEEVSVLEHTDLIIGGKARPTADRVEVLDPSTGETMAAIASATPDDVDDAIAAARGAQKAWSRLLPRDRAQ